MENEKKMEVIKIGMIGIVGVLIAIQFKTQKPEVALYVGIGICVLVFYYAVQGLAGIASQIQVLGKYINAGQGYLSLLLKAVGITYICEFCAGICRDAGYPSVSSQIEILGRLAVMSAGFPIVLAVIEQMEGFWK